MLNLNYIFTNIVFARPGHNPEPGPVFGPVAKPRKGTKK